MKTLKITLLSLAVSLLVWTVWTWPLPRYAGRGIPMGHAGGRGRPASFMEPGDHLQLLYHFWLFSDMLSGDTPWMYNPYEFHTGDEAARRQPGPYYAPFSWIYALAALVSGRAFAYNLAGLVSIWLSYLLTWLLVRRYASSDLLSAAAALVAVILPYRWITLLGGSPTGFAMAAPPLLLWGLDRAVRDYSPAGGFWAGLAILIGFSSDGHTFYFSVLLIPGWCLAALAARGGLKWRSWREYRRLGTALLPVAAGVAVTLVYSLAIKEQLAETVMAEGRGLAEVAIFAPRPSGFFGWSDHHVHGQVYLGYALPLLLLAGAATLVIRLGRERPRPIREALVYLILLGGTAVIAMLAIGPFGPHGGVFWRKAREWIPQYIMIRQTGKIIAVLPPILGVLAGLAGLSLGRVIRSQRVGWLVGGALLLLAGYEHGRRIDPTVCLLTDDQPAYAAVAADAARDGRRPHILAVTLWPGDTHYASLYQYYCSLYRIRMINGYSPAVEASYFDDIFMRYMSVNQGWLTGEQADSLLERGVTHIVLHEDIFPEKVSPFPVGQTISALLANPRLRPLKQDGPIRAFRLLEEPAAPAPLPPDPGILFPARHWLFANLPRREAEVREDRSAGRGWYLELAAPESAVEIPATHSPPVDNLRWVIRARGRGRLAAAITIDGRPRAGETVAVDSPDWTRLEIPAPIEEFSLISLKLTRESGEIDLCSAFLTGGEDLEPAAGEAVALPAGWFFRRGYLEVDTARVHLRAAADSAGAAFYGPKLPLPRGDYEIELDFDSPARPGTPLGRLYLEQLFTAGGHDAVPVIAGEPAALDFTVSEELPLNAVFEFGGGGDVTINALTIRRRRRQ